MCLCVSATWPTVKVGVSSSCVTWVSAMWGGNTRGHNVDCGQHHRGGAWLASGHFTMAVLCCGITAQLGYGIHSERLAWPEKEWSGQETYVQWYDLFRKQREEESKLFTVYSVMWYPFSYSIPCRKHIDRHVFLYNWFLSSNNIKQ